MVFDDFLKNFQKKEIVHFPTLVKPGSIISVCVVTYNHVNYIKECLDGILAQETDFEFEILLGEDSSTDGTREICIEYAKRHPNKIRLFLHHRENNIKIGGKPTGRFNFLYNLFTAKGKYIALCEGDDYWTDPLKLQKQVDFLESNPTFSICFTKAYTLKKKKFEIHPLPFDKNVFTGEDLLETYNFICTASVVYKAASLSAINNIERYPFGDLALHLLASKNHKIKYLDELTTVYRIHDKGQWSKLTNREQLINYLEFYKFYLPNATFTEKKIIKTKAYKKIQSFRFNKKYVKNHFFKIRLLMKYSFLRIYLPKYLMFFFNNIFKKVNV